MIGVSELYNDVGNDLPELYGELEENRPPEMLAKQFCQALYNAMADADLDNIKAAIVQKDGKNHGMGI